MDQAALLPVHASVGLLGPLEGELVGGNDVQRQLAGEPPRQRRAAPMVPPGGEGGRQRGDLAAAEREPPAVEGAATLALSARSGEGLDALRVHLKQCMGFQGEGAGRISARARHLEALRRAQRFVEAAATQLLDRRAGELVAEELRQAQQALGEITGAVHSDELLGRIFSSFCIGK